MPQASTFTIAKDGAAGTYSLAPKQTGDVALFQDDSAATVSGRVSLRASHRLATDSSAGKSRFVLKVPTEGTVDGVVQVVREQTVIIEILTAPDSTLTERTNLMISAPALLSSALVTGIVQDGAKVW